MSYPPSIEKALAYLKAADIPNYLKNEKMWFVHRVFWKLGISFHPAILVSFPVNFIYFGIIGTIILLSVPLLFIYGLYWHNKLTALEWTVYLMLNFVIHGTMMARSIQHRRRNLGLRSWQEIQNLPDNSEENP